MSTEHILATQNSLNKSNSRRIRTIKDIKDATWYRASDRRLGKKKI